MGRKRANLGPPVLFTSMTSLLQHIGPFNEVPDEYSPEAAAEALATSRVLVIGAGGLGCEILKNLALTGFKHIDVIDMDTIDISNLNRQFLFRQKDVGRSKAEVAVEFIRQRLRDPQLHLTPHFCKIQDKPLEYYRTFDVVICGLDSVEARRWINATLVSFVDETLAGLIPMIDGGTEGFRGQLRVILPTVTSCYECTLDMVTPKTTYPVCTIANTPRLPEHCIEYASVIEWLQRVNHAFDADDPADVETMYQLALARASQFSILGVTKLLTLGVVKNIIPAIASTNAIIAALCCNEAFKLVTSINPILDNYMMYSGDESIFTYTYAHSKKPNCLVCGNKLKHITVLRSWTLQEFLDDLSTQQEIQARQPLVSSASGMLYMRAPESLEVATRPNLDRPLSQLITSGQELVVTDPELPMSIRVQVNLE